MRLILLALPLALLAACKKETPTAEPSGATPSASASASAAPASASAASATATAAASGTASAASAPTAPTGAAGVAASAASAASAGTAAAPGGELPGAEGMKAAGSHYEVSVPTPRTCAKGGPCALTVRLTAGDGFHVNKDYPTKLTLDEAPGVEMLGTDAKGKNVFSKSAGDFVIDGEKLGTMSAKFKPAAPGLSKLAGTFKFSVCSQANCQMETAKVTATVPVR